MAGPAWNQGLMPRPYGLGHGPLTISRAFANVMLVIPRIANLPPMLPSG
jgi:hypothetical protein